MLEKLGKLCGFVMKRCSCVVLGFCVLSQVNGYFDERFDDYFDEHPNEYSENYFESDEKSSKKRNLEGLYIGLGVFYDYFKSRVLMDDNMSQLARFRYNPTYYEKSEGYYYEPDAHGLPILSANEHRFGGSISVGYGSFFSDNSWFTDNCYLGVELVADVAGPINLNSEDIVVNNRNNPQGKIDFGKCSVKYEGIVPTAALRFGGYVHAIDSLVFLKVGCKYLRYKMDFEFFPDQTVRSSIFTPTAGLGIEKNMGHGFSLKAEVDYSFRSNKTHNAYKGNFENGPDDKYQAKLKHRVEGCTVRLTGVYHI